MPVSLREVAVRAGVARGTASSILNDRANQVRISQQTQERVRQVAAEMGYRPNRFAQSLGKGRTNIIGLMIPGLRNPFFLGLMEIAEERALQAGYDVLTDTAFQIRASYAVQGKLSGWPVDGILLWATPDKTLADYMGSWTNDIPVVYLGYQRSDNTDFVALDREMGVRLIMQHLRQQGYKRIAYLYPWVDLQPVDARYAMYAAVCEEIGQEPERIFLKPLEPQERLALVTQAGLREAGLETGLALSLLPAHERPDAIICHNDLVAIGLCHGLRRGGLRVPSDIAVTGFDGIDEGKYLDKPLTTVISPGIEIIETALGILTDRLSAADNPHREPKQIILPTTLRIGSTT